MSLEGLVNSLVESFHFLIELLTRHGQPHTSRHLISMASPANQGYLLMLTAVFPDYLNNLAKLLAMLFFFFVFAFCFLLQH